MLSSILILYEQLQVRPSRGLASSTESAEPWLSLTLEGHSRMSIPTQPPCMCCVQQSRYGCYKGSLRPEVYRANENTIILYSSLLNFAFLTQDLHRLLTSVVNALPISHIYSVPAHVLVILVCMQADVWRLSRPMNVQSRCALLTFGFRKFSILHTHRMAES